VDSAKAAQITAHALALAALLYEETDAEKLKTLGGIEEAIREHMQGHVNPAIANFLSQQVAKPQQGAAVRLPAFWER